MKKWAIFVKIFVYLLNIVFVSLQPYMRETKYCLRKFNCLTKAKSLTLDWREARFTRHKTSYFHFLFFFTSSLWDKEIINFVSNFLQNIFAKVSFPLLKSWPWHHSMFLEFSFFSTTSGNLLCFSKTSKINANNILSRRNWNLRKNSLLLALSYELQFT